MELVNTHCHSKLCGHAVGEVSEYAAAAEAAGVAVLAFTEHYPLSCSYDPDSTLSVSREDLPLYLEQVRQARRDHPGIEIILGCEMDYLGPAEDRVITADDLAPFELVLGSVHFVDGWAFDDPSEVDKWQQPGEADRIWTRYFDLWCEAAADPAQPFHVMSHPDLAKKFGFYPTYDLQPLYERAAEAARAGGRMIELNTSGAFYPCAEAYPAPDMLRAFCRAGVPCTVGADSHDPANIVRGVRDAYGILYEAGYRVLTVPTSTGDRREIVLE